MRICLGSSLVLAGLFSACGDDTHACTLELRTAFVVRVVADQTTFVDQVTTDVGAHGEQRCYPLFASGDAGATVQAGQPVEFACHERGGGDYLVRVYSGDKVWTRTVPVKEESDGCHVVRDTPEQNFDLSQDDPAK